MDTLERVKDCDKSHVSGLILQGGAWFKLLSELIWNSPACLTEQGPSQLLQNGSGELWAGELTLQWSWRFSRGNLFICLFWQKSFLVGETAKSCLLRVNNHKIPHSCQQLPTFAYSVAVGRTCQPNEAQSYLFTICRERIGFLPYQDWIMVHFQYQECVFSVTLMSNFWISSFCLLMQRNEFTFSFCFLV